MARAPDTSGKFSLLALTSPWLADEGRVPEIVVKEMLLLKERKFWPRVSGARYVDEQVWVV